MDERADMLGNQALRARLAQLAAQQQLHPCLVFEGPEGVGKAATAQWLAQVANCDDAQGPAACGQCWSCRAIADGRHPDFVRVQPDPSKASFQISVAQARTLTQSLSLRPFRARHRMVLIEPADRLTTEAANALLKTLEEPPAQTGFVLVTAAPASLLATVRSRSQRVRFGPVATEELRGWLVARGTPEKEAGLLARFSDGSPGRALALAGGELSEWRASRDAVLDALEGDLDHRLRFSEKLVKGDRAAWTKRVLRTMDALQRLVRDALVVHHQGARGALLYNPDRVDTVQRWADRLQDEGVIRLEHALAQASERQRLYVNGRLMLDALLASLHAEIGETAA